MSDSTNPGACHCGFDEDGDICAICDDCRRKISIMLEQGISPETIAMKDYGLSALIRTTFKLPQDNNRFSMSAQRYAFK